MQGERRNDLMWTFCLHEVSAPLRLIKIGTLIFSPGFATVGRSKERAFEQKEKVHKHFPLSR